jgi:hypothetical protein
MASFHADYIAGFDEGVAGLMESCIRDKGKNCAMAEVADKFESPPSKNDARRGRGQHQEACFGRPSRWRCSIHAYASVAQC